MTEQTQDRGPQLLGVFGAAITVASLAVILRFWVRARMVRKVGADDWIMALSLLLTLASISCMTASVHHGLGKHTETLTSTQSLNALRMLWVGFCFTPSAEATAKISITLMVMQFTISAKWKRFFISLITLMVLITVTILIALLLSCWPVQLLWDPSINGYCNPLERTVILYIQGGMYFSAFLTASMMDANKFGAVIAACYDIILAASPVFLLWKVKMRGYDKTLLCGLLALGLFTSVAAILRIVYSSETHVKSDATYAIANFLTWKIVELALSVIVGCLPTLRPLFKRYKPDREGPHWKAENMYMFTDNRLRQNIRKTPPIGVDVSAVLASDIDSV
ncbi:MAG: hypothetical protein Q9167_006269 [Letrouitia subvulpina]